MPRRSTSLKKSSRSDDKPMFSYRLPFSRLQGVWLALAIMRRVQPGWISLRSVPKSIGLVKNAWAPFSSA